MFHICDKLSGLTTATKLFLNMWYTRSYSVCTELQTAQIMPTVIYIGHSSIKASKTQLNTDGGTIPQNSFIEFYNFLGVWKVAATIFVGIQKQ